jgi:transcriptional regulator with XRE-family HTH domain
MQTIGDRITEARKSASLTQQQLADRLGIRAGGRQRVSGWETGSRTPNRSNLAKIALATGTSAAWIEYGVGAMDGGN